MRPRVSAFTSLFPASVLLSQHFWVVAVSQVATAIAGAAIGPAVNGMTLGIVKQAWFNRQNGINQAFNHAGNMIGAALSGLLGWMFGITAVFWLAALFALLSVISVLMVPSGAIDNASARGLKHKEGEDDKASGYQVLAECKPLFVLAASLLLFHLGNAAMLPLYGMAVVSDKHADPASFVAITIVVAQGIMILTSLAAMQLGEQKGLWLVLLISFAALPVRGVVAALVHKPMGRLPCANPRRYRRRFAKCGGTWPCRAHPQWHRTHQCRVGDCYDGARRWSLPQSCDRRLDRTGNRLQRDVPRPRRLCDRFGRFVAWLRIDRA